MENLSIVQAPKKPKIKGVGEILTSWIRIIDKMNEMGSYPERQQIFQLRRGETTIIHHMTITRLQRLDLIDIYRFEVGYGWRWRTTTKATKFLKKLDAWLEEWEPKKSNK